ncbi:MAG: hypothetical protein ACOYXT_02260 [Bacteroidota bacterium]
MPFQISGDRTIFLIREELKVQKFFNSLRQIGLQDSPYQPDFSELILSELGLNDGSEQIFAFYFELIERHCNKMEPNADSFHQHALAVYEALISKKGN